MTLCIGAMAHQPSPLEKRIVLCFDYKVAGDEFGSESEYKFHVLSEQLVCLFAGAPGRAKELANIYRGFLGNIELSEADVESQLREPLRIFKRRHADWFIQRRLCFSYQDLLDHGEKWLGQEGRGKYLAAIDAHDLGVQLIIAGFIGSAPVLYQTTGKGQNLDLEPVPNFCLIGTGAYTAEPALHARSQVFSTPLSQALYNVYEAKRMGEASPYVGQKTRLYVLRPPDPATPKRTRVEVVTEDGEKWLQGLFRKHRPKPMRTWLDMPKGTLRDALS